MEYRKPNWNTQQEQEQMPSHRAPSNDFSGQFPSIKENRTEVNVVGELSSNLLMSEFSSQINPILMNQDLGESGLRKQTPNFNYDIEQDLLPIQLLRQIPPKSQFNNDSVKSSQINASRLKIDRTTESTFNLPQKTWPPVSSSTNYQPKKVLDFFNSQTAGQNQDDDLRVNETIKWPNEVIRFERINELKTIRAWYIDWLVGMCAEFDQKWSTLWLAVRIFDQAIHQHFMDKENIFFFGCTSLFLASKHNQSSKQRISMASLEKKISPHNMTTNQITECELFIIQKLKPIPPSKSIYEPTYYDRVTDMFPGISYQKKIQVMMELLYCIQDISLTYTKESEHLTEKRIVASIETSVNRGERHKGSEYVEKYMLENHGCKNIREFGLKLRL